METISREYKAVVRDLAERAKLEHGEKLEKIKRAIDDGFIYDDDKAFVLAQAVEERIIQWGEDIDWTAVEDMLLLDISAEMEEEN